MRSIKYCCLAITLVGLALFLSSCAVGPDFQKPDAPVVSSFTRDPGVETSSQNIPINREWWKSYGSQELNDLVAMALQHNPNIDVAIANLKIAQQNVIAQQGFFFPIVGAGYSASRQNVGGTLAPAINGTSSIYNLQTAQLSVGFTPDIFGGNRRQVESLKAAAKAQEYQLEALRTTIATNVVATAIQEAVLREQLKLSIESVAAAKDQLRHARLMTEKGYASGIDLANQEAMYAQSLAQVPALRKAREQTLDLLNILCGKLPNEKLVLPQLDSIHLPEKMPSAIASNLVEQRPDVKIAEELVRSSNAQIGVAIANMIPQFSIVGIVGGSAEIFSEMFNGANNIWGVAGGVSQPLFAGGTLLARKSAAEAGLDASIAQYKATVLVAFQNVADTLYALQNDGEIYSAARDSEIANQSAYIKIQAQYEKGYTSEPNLLSVKQQLLQAKINTAQAFSVYLGDTAALYQSLGGGWKLTH